MRPFVVRVALVAQDNSKTVEDLAKAVEKADRRQVAYVPASAGPSSCGVWA